jgi:hypothetical protein
MIDSILDGPPKYYSGEAGKAATMKFRGKKNGRKRGTFTHRTVEK